MCSSQCACRKSSGQRILCHVLHLKMQVTLLELAQKVKVFYLRSALKKKTPVICGFEIWNICPGHHVQHEGYCSESPGRAGMAIGMICGTFWLWRGVGGNESRCSIATAPGADLNKLHWRVISRYIVSKHMKKVCIEIVLHKNTIQFFTTDRYDAGILSWVHSWISLPWAFVWGSVRGATKRWCQDHAGFKEQSFEDSKEGHQGPR